MRKRSSAIGKAVRSRRAELHLSQRDVARAAGTTAAAVSHIERGIRQPSADLLARIAAALGCPSDDLLRGVAPRLAGYIHVARAVAAMKELPPASQKEVVEFCGILKRRNEEGKAKD